jgi:outer membrane protein OmpA-like peptidoglycan-associated protein
MRKIMTIALMATIGGFSACSEMNRDVQDQEDINAIASADTAVMYGDEYARMTAEGVEIRDMEAGRWAPVDRTAPVREDATLRGTGVEARGTDDYTIYSMDESILFELDKSELKSGAEDKLERVAESIRNMGPEAQLYVIGHTDSTAGRAYNKQLGEDRARTVKEWLENTEDFDPARMTVESRGQTNPVASNETPEGRQKNRRVEIIVVKNQADAQGQMQGQGTQQQRQ